MRAVQTSESRVGSLSLKADVLIIGSGFASSILARALASRGLSVVMVERQQHPRFALGESTTPLANIALERLARRYGWHELWTLAAWGRWRSHHPDLRCGKKRGFTFVGHATRDQNGVHPAPDQSPVMIAASMSDALADTNWRRADVDAFLVSKARQAGARVLELTELTSLSIDDGETRPIRARGIRRSAELPVEEQVRIDADFVVDGSGGRGFLAQQLGLPQRTHLPFATSLLFSHFEDLPPMTDLANREPYAAEWSAMHHLLDLGWLYELRFDDGLASCGWVLDHQRCRREGFVLPEGKLTAQQAESLHSALLARYPSLASRFSQARSVRQMEFRGQMPWRYERAAGERFALLPHAYAFYDPMFSVGIAWSLLAVERLCDILDGGVRGLDSSREQDLLRYDRLVAAEGDHIEALLAGANLVQHDVGCLGWYSQVYFAAASFTETQQRLLEESGPGWHWRGFLGAEEPELVEMVRLARLAAERKIGEPEWRSMVPPLIAPWNVAGLANEACHPLYSVDPETVVASAELLGLSHQQARRLLPRLSEEKWGGR